MRMMTFAKRCAKEILRQSWIRSGFSAGLAVAFDYHAKEYSGTPI